jgi:hypothetical protein
MALVAGTTACAGIALLVRADGRLALARTRRLARTETVRIGAAVLRRELTHVLPLEDVRGAGGDTVRLRLFRGLAVACAASGADGVPVAFVGDRQPDPSKDSVLPLAPAGAPALALAASSRVPLTAAALAALDRGAGTPCAGLPADSGRGEVLVWQLAKPVTRGTPLLLFQHGTYAVSERAIRLRYGNEGRQPLTGEWLDSRRSRLEVLSLAAGPDAARVDVRLYFPANAAERRLRLPFGNARSSPPGDSPP